VVQRVIHTQLLYVIIGRALLPPTRTLPSGEKYTITTVMTQNSASPLKPHAKPSSIHFVTAFSTFRNRSLLTKLTTTVATRSSHGGQNIIPFTFP
jgi:hypothetical protein